MKQFLGELFLSIVLTVAFFVALTLIFGAGAGAGGCTAEQWDRVADGAKRVHDATTQPEVSAVGGIASALFPQLQSILAAIGVIATGVYGIANAMAKRKAQGALSELAGDVATYKKPFEEFSAATTAVLEQLGHKDVATPANPGT